MGRIEDPDAQGLATFRQRRFGLFSEIVKASVYVIPGQIRDLRLQMHPDLPSGGEDARQLALPAQGWGDAGANRHITANARRCRALLGGLNLEDIGFANIIPLAYLFLAVAPVENTFVSVHDGLGRRNLRAAAGICDLSLGLEQQFPAPIPEILQCIPVDTLNSVEVDRLAFIPEHLAEGQIPDLANLYHDLSHTLNRRTWLDGLACAPIRIRKERDLELEPTVARQDLVDPGVLGVEPQVDSGHIAGLDLGNDLSLLKQQQAVGHCRVAAARRVLHLDLGIQLLRLLVGVVDDLSADDQRFPALALAVVRNCVDLGCHGLSMEGALS